MKYATLLLGLAGFLAGCEKSAGPAASGTTRADFTASGVIYRILETDSGQAASAGIRVGDSVTYTYRVDVLQRGFREYPEGRYPETDSSDRAGRRPRYFFDSLMTPTLQLRDRGPAPYTRYFGYRTEQENGYAGTFFTHEFNLGDSVLKASVCFNDEVGGPFLPSVGDAVEGSEHFYRVSTQKSITIRSDLTVISIQPVP